MIDFSIRIHLNSALIHCYNAFKFLSFFLMQAGKCKTIGVEMMKSSFVN